MVTYFRSTFPSRFILLILLFAAIRVPLLVFGVPLTVPELKFLVLGERLADGFTMYKDVYDTTAPLSAGLFWLLDEAFGRSELAYRILASLLLLLQALWLNGTFLRNQVHPEKSYVPALLYLVAGSAFFELDTLRPLLFGNTFVVFSLRYLISFSKAGFNNRKLFKAGFMLGLAALCYLPLALFLIVGFFAIVLFASNAFRSFLLMLCGFWFTYAIAFTYYLYFDAMGLMIDFHLLSAWQLHFDFLLKPLQLLRLLAFPLILLFISLLYIPAINLSLNYQFRFLQLMVVWLLTAVLVAFASKVISGITLVLFLPVLAYFGTFLFNFKRKKWVTDSLFLIFMAGILITRYQQFFGLDKYLQTDVKEILLPEEPLYPQVKGQEIVVFGNDLAPYEHNKLATPYLNWQLSQEQFQNLDRYYSVFRIYQNFKDEQPEYIVDEAGVMPELKQKLPGIFGSYELSQKPALYQLK